MQRPFAAILWLMIAELGLDLTVPVAWAAMFRGRRKFRRDHYGIHEHGLDHLRLHFSIDCGLDVCEVRVVSGHVDERRRGLFSCQLPMVEGGRNAIVGLA